MNVIDIGCGSDPERWLPGADLLENNFNYREGDPHNLSVMSYDNFDLVPSGQYDMIWSSYSFRYNSAQAFIEQCHRIARPKATVNIRDYIEWDDWENDGEPTYPDEETFRKWFIAIWTSFGWNVDTFLTFSVDGNDFQEFHAVITLGWG
jgi:hypothetical protein